MEKNLKPIGALLADSWRLYKKHMNVFALISVIPFLFIGVKMVLSPYLYASVGFSENLASTSISAVFSLIYLLFIIILPFALSAAIDEAERGRKPNVNEVYKKAFSSIVPYLAVVLIAGIIIFGGSVLFIIPGIIAGIYLSFSMYAFIFEGKTGIDALILSAWYVRKFWWDILARKITLAVVLILVVMVFSGIVGPIIYILGFGPSVFQFLFDLFVFMIIIPFALTVYYNMYKDAKHAQAARGNHSVPEKSFLLEAEKIFVVLIIVAAVAAVSIFLLVSLTPPMPPLYHHAMMMRMRYHG